MPGKGREKGTGTSGGTTGEYKLTLVNVPVAPVTVTFIRVAAERIIQQRELDNENAKTTRLPK
jgi:hypothetical protein